MVVIGMCDVCGRVHEPPFTCQSCGHVTARAGDVIHDWTLDWRVLPGRFVCRDGGACYARFVAGGGGDGGEGRRSAAGAG